MANHQKHKNITFQITPRHNEVDASCFFIYFTFPDGTTHKYVVDIGLCQNEEMAFLNNYDDMSFKDVEAIFLTHNHCDHVGAVPLAKKRGFEGKFYTTTKTQSTINIALNDSAKIIERMATLNKTKVLYNADDVSEALKDIEGHEFEKTFSLNENIKVTFFENGHLLGAAIILFQLKYKAETLNVLFTGDYNANNFFFTPKKLPKWVTKLDNLVIIQEATYGDTVSAEIKETFDEDIEKLINDKKSILIPCIAQERFEIVLAHLKELQEDGIITSDVDIVLDGNLAMQYLRKYIKEYGEDFMPEDVIYANTTLDKTVFTNSNRQRIILTTSGMCKFGPVREYLLNVIDNPNWAIYFTCYQATDTGRKLLSLNPENKLELFGKIVELRASVYHTSEFSSHAKQDELIEFLKQFEHINTVLINHGDTEVKQIYKEKLEELNIVKEVAILNRKTYYILNKYGIIDFRNTKFAMKAPKSSNNSFCFKKKIEKKINRRGSGTNRTVFKVYSQKHFDMHSFATK